MQWQLFFIWHLTQVNWEIGSLQKFLECLGNTIFIALATLKLHLRGVSLSRPSHRYCFLEPPNK